MSFSYWGADKITVQKTAIKGKPGAVTTRRGTPLASYGRESSANAKFGTRLIASDTHHPSSARPSSRRTMNSTPAGRRPSAPPTSEETPNYAKSTITRSAWDSSTKPNRAGSNTAPSTTRKRNTSQTSSATKATVTSSYLVPPKIASPVPSDDSGVGLGLYQKVLANDPSLSNA
jgi:hypothetical protein